MDLNCNYFCQSGIGLRIGLCSYDFHKFPWYWVYFDERRDTFQKTLSRRYPILFKNQELNNVVKQIMKNITNENRPSISLILSTNDNTQDLCLKRFNQWEVMITVLNTKLTNEKKRFMSQLHNQPLRSHDSCVRLCYVYQSCALEYKWKHYYCSSYTYIYLYHKHNKVMSCLNILLIFVWMKTQVNKINIINHIKTYPYQIGDRYIDKLIIPLR